jgi:hypothetical protein
LSDNGTQTETLALLVKAEVVTPTALNLPVGLEEDQFRSVCKWLGGLRDWSTWAAGDAILYAESISDDLAAEIVEYLGRAKSTCVKWAWLASQYKPDERVKGLSPTHHELVAKMPGREEMLRAALDENLSVEEFRGLVRPQPEVDVLCTCVPSPACPKHGNVEA